MTRQTSAHMGRAGRPIRFPDLGGGPPDWLAVRGVCFGGRFPYPDCMVVKGSFAVLVVGVALSVVAAPAHAGGITECGNWGYSEQTGHSGWTYGEISGAGIYNVTTRNVRCATA